MFFVNRLASEGRKPSVGELTSMYDINTCEHRKIGGLVGEDEDHGRSSVGARSGHGPPNIFAKKKLLLCI
jgi:hypothetical protein